ncbi:hypothetical protein [Umezawaea tangerina]|uniref:Type VII secretion system (Wss) protein ESAT-6 n=1 Tax=Umezawaea tangerina TaxID=84725 RepID=A0A2T0SE57_9PSEU|nr:hypothetical protein [Umezawaea tangerina]PRY31697.1 hypothetical protein CLV43_122103 [Umezawaea tangerina]
MTMIGNDATTDNALVDKGTDIHNQYSTDKMVTSTVAVLVSSVNPAMLPVGIATGQFSNTDDFDGLNDGTVIDSIQQLCEQVGDGDWASAVTSALGLLVDTTGAIMDPIGFVAGQLVGWMLEHVEPLRLLLHQLTGHPGMVEAYANTWQNIAKRMAEKATVHLSAMQDETRQWKGQAADAYRASALMTIKQAAGAALTAQALSESAARMKDVVDTVRGGVRDILADLAGTLVTCAIEAASVAGAPDAARRALQVIAKSALKAEDLLLKLALVISKLEAPLVDLVQLQGELHQPR